MTFTNYNLHNHCNMHMSKDHRQSALKALLNTLEMCHKIHTMTTRYGNHDMEDVPSFQGSAPLDLVPPDHTMPRGDNESYDTPCPLTELLQLFWQLQDQFACLKSATHPPAHTPELMKLTDKLQYLTMMLQPQPPPA